MNEEIINAIFGSEIVKRLNNHLCPMCGQEINELDFRDDLSKREYNISGMCKQCQEKFWSND